MDQKQFHVRELPSVWGINQEQEWLVEGLIPLKSVTMLTGESGSGKSSLSLALAHAVATGEPFLGCSVTQKPTLIVDRENGVSVYTSRIERFGLEETPNLMVWGHWSGLEPGAPDHKAIVEFVQEEQPFIIFDSFIAFHPASEQDSSETRRYMDLFRKLSGLGATVMVVHHTGKSEFSKEYRGSSDIKASIDVGLVLSAKAPLLKMLSLKIFKSREGIVEPLQISLEGQKFVVVDRQFVTEDDPSWAQVISCIEQNPGINQSQLVKLLPEMTQGKIRKTLLAAELKGSIKVEKGLKNASFYFPGDQQHARKPDFSFSKP